MTYQLSWARQSIKGVAIYTLNNMIGCIVLSPFEMVHVYALGNTNFLTDLLLNSICGIGASGQHPHGRLRFNNVLEVP